MYALCRLLTNYWFEVDFKGAGSAHEYYLADGVFAVGDNRFEGHTEIQAFYAWRQRRGHTTSRHLLNNLQVLPEEEPRVRLVGVLSLYWADGRPRARG